MRASAERKAGVLVLLLGGCNSTWKNEDSGAPVNHAPTVSIETPGLGLTFVTTDIVKLSATVSDDQDAPEDLSLSVFSSLQGVVAQPEADTAGKMEVDMSLIAGVHELQLTATDSSGVQESDTVTIRVLRASFPSQPVVEIEPVAATTGQALAAIILKESVDPEGDSLKYVWSWTVDGADAGISNSVVDGAMVQTGQTWKVSVYAADSTTQSAAATAEAVIVDGVPDPGLVTISPANPSPGNLLSCLYTNNPPKDPEGLTITPTFAWSRNGADLGIATNTLDTTGFLKGDLVNCSVVVDDGVNQQAWPSAEVTLGNTPPVGTFAFISPDIATEGTTLSCVGGGMDPDGDPVTIRYSWFVNGVETAVQQTLDGDDFRKNDSIVCKAIPNDGSLDGSEVASNALKVSNTPPTAPTVEFVRSDLVPGVPASCAVTVAATDVDEDPLSYQWVWWVNGVQDAETSSVRATSDLNANDVLTCMAMADDGDALGPSGEASLTLASATSGNMDSSMAFATVLGPSDGSGFGRLISTVGDLDADGVRDLLVSAPNADGAGAGSVYVFASGTLSAGGTFADSDATYSWEGDAAGDGLGSAGKAADAGDIDGDGRPDLMLAAPAETSGGTGAGMVYLLYGGTRWSYGLTISSSANARIHGNSSDAIGTCLAADDFDGDGFSDVVMSGPTSNHGATNAGLLAVFKGDKPRYAGLYDANSADALIYGTTANSELGWTLAAVGDPNNDGYPDLASSLIYDDTNGTDAGTAVVLSGNRFSGGLSWLRASYLVIHGMSAGDHFGQDLAGPGDVDQDGVDDLLVAGNTTDAVGTDSGELRLFFGATGINRELDASAAAVTFRGQASNDTFGSMIAGVGDFDGDGWVDFLVGAPGASRGAGAESGEATLYLGSSLSDWLAGDTSADITVGGSQAGDGLGGVAGNLDLNSDGYSDLVMSAPDATVSSQALGAVYLFEGP